MRILIGGDLTTAEFVAQPPGDYTWFLARPGFILKNDHGIGVRATKAAAGPILIVSESDPAEVVIFIHTPDDVVRLVKLPCQQFTRKA